MKPQVWFLDEPFSALDPLIRREMQDELMRLQRMLHKTIVFITHDFDEAVRIADRLAIMKDGVVIQAGTPEEIIANPATDYVQAFTKDAPKGKVLTARSIMTPINGSRTGRRLVLRPGIGDHQGRGARQRGVQRRPAVGGRR